LEREAAPGRRGITWRARLMIVTLEGGGKMRGEDVILILISVERCPASFINFHLLSSWAGGGGCIIRIFFLKGI
jgi:hypothetical protein